MNSAHDLSEGGLGLALAEGVLRHGVGATVSLGAVTDRDGIDDFTALCSESTARVVVSVRPQDAEGFEGLCAEHDQPVLRLGTTGGESLHVQGLFELSVPDLRTAHTGVIEAALGQH